MLVAEESIPELPKVEHLPLRELHIDDIWRANVKKAMKEQKLNQRDLAAHVGCVQGNISQVLSTKHGQSHSVYAQRISVTLGVPLTVPARAALAIDILNSNGDESAAAAWVSALEATADRYQSGD